MEPGAEAVRAAKGSAGLVVQSVVNAALGLAFFMVLARFISIEEMGIYAVLLSTYLLFQVMGTFGLTGAAARYIPKLLGEGSEEKASAASLRILELALLTSITASLAYYLLAPFFSIYLVKSVTYVGLFRFAALVVFLTSFSFIPDGLMQGLQEFRALAAIRILVQLIRVLLTIALLVLGYGLYGVLVGWALWALLSIILFLPFILRRLKLRGAYPVKEILAFSTPLIGAMLLLFMSSYMDLFFVMFYLLPADVGVYNVACMATSQLSFIIIGPIQATLLPAMAKAFGHGGIRAVERIFTKASRYIAFLYIPSAFGLAALAWPVVWLMAGRIYGDAVFPVAMISIFSIALGLSTPITLGLQSVGQTIPVFKITGVALAIDAAICLLGIPFLGILGASLGRSMLYLTILVHGIYLGRRFIALRFDLYATLKALAAGGFMALMVAVLTFFYTSVYLLPLYIATGLVVYIFGLKALRGLKDYDLKVLESSLPSGLRWALNPLRKLLVS